MKSKRIEKTLAGKGNQDSEEEVISLYVILLH